MFKIKSSKKGSEPFFIKRMKKGSDPFFVLLLSLLFISQFAMPSFALMPMKPEDVKRLKAVGKYDAMMQQWRDFTDRSKLHPFEPSQLIARAKHLDEIEVVLRGDNLPNKPTTDLDGNGITDERDALELGYEVNRAAQRYPFHAPPSGDQKTIVIPVDFRDLHGDPSHGTSYWDTWLFSKGVTDTPSMRDYYAEVSRGVLNCIGTVADSGDNGGWFRIDKNASNYYGFDNAPYLVSKAIDLADPYIDFSQFDNDNDGVVDSLIVIAAGPADWYTFWPHAWELYEPKVCDGVTLSPYFLATEDSYCGTFAHEHGHAMGLPDLYDYDGSSYGVGIWCLMGYGCYCGDEKTPCHLNAFCKDELGWITPIQITENMLDAAIIANPNAEQVYKVWWNGKHYTECFYVENRQNRNCDSYLPGEGILIWHFDKWGNQEVDSKRICDLEEADGRRDIDTMANWGDNTDPFYFEGGNTYFTDFTNPNAHRNDGSPTGIGIIRISSLGDPMYATLIVKEPAIEDIEKVEGIPISPKKP